jgi:hypothetical protein
MSQKAFRSTRQCEGDRSTASLGTAERIVARILFNVLRDDSGTRARYWLTVFGAGPAFFIDLRVLDFRFFHGGNSFEGII